MNHSTQILKLNWRVVPKEKEIYKANRVYQLEPIYDFISFPSKF